MRKIIAAVSAAVLTAAVSACSAPMDADSFKGKWALFTAGGSEVDTDGMVTVTITDSEFISKSASAQGSFGYMPTAEGLALQNENGVTFLKAAYRAEDDTLSYTVQQDGKDIEYVFVRAETVFSEGDPPAEEAAIQQ